MQDLVQDYVTDLNRLREEFHNELAAIAAELSKALAHYAQRNDAALASFMEKASARGMELEISAAARLSQFRGLPAEDSPPEVNDRPPPPSNVGSDAARIATAAQRAIGYGLDVESNRDREPEPAPLDEPVDAGGRLIDFMSPPASAGKRQPDEVAAKDDE
ncbi:MAG TPA: hypothetical protein VJY34_07400 [Roseiarcus sp.]|nr:hypothetical protein [Roseiarcus sp.]